ncbi:tyrosine-type recombinase/integrase [Arthrobacter sp. STN4]|uniref:tyrosine-type recombinase/integrase n=1 Tax=Arthrobacter sp. STN4 TaxID=2923276 RepID=UPI00211A0228|nr:tyrosine-type recombinase/integrase [Arthrobacter sp. STN4]MCQ9165553.1 site-specific integrase [Arthrobacter sp. STN4]
MASDIPHNGLPQPTGLPSDITLFLAKPRHGRTPVPLPGHFAAIWESYAAALDTAPLDADTRRAYASRLRGYLSWIAATDTGSGDPLTGAGARDGAVRDYRTHLQTVLKRKPTTINAHLAAIADFYTRSTSLGVPLAARLDLPRTVSRALDAREQTRWLRACERCLNPRDRALGYLAFYAGLRISEMVALDCQDVPLSARKGQIIIRSGKGRRYREIPAHPILRENLHLWIHIERTAWTNAETNPALFLNRRGERLSVKGADDILNTLATDAGIEEFTSHRPRHTFGTNLVRAGNDIVLAAELMGHARLETTRRYTLPTAADSQSAINALPTDN